MNKSALNSLLFLIPLIAIGTIKIMSTPRGVRNNNPGNIRGSRKFKWQGEIGRDNKDFVKFEKPEDGFRAMARVLTSYYDVHKIHNLRDIIFRYAPPSENKSLNYLSFVVDKVGVPGGVDLTREKFIEILPKLIFAMSIMENGMGHFTMTQAETGFSMA